jgi:alpha-beta hydrolase superfamily lysophospholipase
LSCTSLLYYPSNALYVDLNKLKNKPEEVKTILDDGLEIMGWYFHTPKKPAKAVVLFFHGNAENRSTHFWTLYWLLDHGYDLTIFDYPGYGQSDGDPSPESTVKMAAHVIKRIKARNPKLPLVVYGQSLGGAIAQRAVWEIRDELKPDMLIIDGSFNSYRSIARRMLAKHFMTWLFQPIGWLVMNDKWAPGNKIGELKGVPVIVIHSKTDQVIPYDQGVKIFEAAAEPKQLWLRETGVHIHTYSGKEGEKFKEKLVKALPR